MVLQRKAEPKSMPELTVRFWGVRGSLATPGSSTARHGGNTSCVEIRAGDELLIFDMGSGLRELGCELEKQASAAGKKIRATFFVSHYHWDHINGLPFFGPAFHDSDANLTVYGATRLGKTVREILAGQMTNPYSPISLATMQAQLLFRSMEGGGRVQLGNATVTACEINHPGGSLAYRVQMPNASVVYATDFEHGTGADDALIKFAHGTDLLIYDSMYTDAEYAHHKGWGHSTGTMGARIAKAAQAKRLVLFHHDPSHSDERIDEIVKAVRRRFVATDAAEEQRVYELPARPVARHRPVKRVTRRKARAPHP